jgi:D-alanyl-D-alanine-carboxypeptidase/D-alanyl-D-alanine-endopeptidase
MRLLIGMLVACAWAHPAFAEDPLLEETVAFTGQIFHLDNPAPGLVMAAVRGNDSVVVGFGEVAKGTGRAPDGNTMIGVGSITKSFTGLVLAHLAADGTVALTDEAGPYVEFADELPTRDGRAVRLLDLATHSAGFRRELLPVADAEKYSTASFTGNLGPDALLFAPGTGILYSNIGFDVLGMALSGAAERPYDELLAETVLTPLGLSSTGYARPHGENVFAGYDWNGEPMDPGDPIPNRFGASALYTTGNDMVRYLAWNLDRFGDQGTEARALAHAAWRVRDGLGPVYGMDESGRMDAMGLGWVVMMPAGDRPLILQKAGGANGVFSYIAFAPTRGVGVFMSINQFDFASAEAMAEVANGLIGALTGG